MGEHPSFHEGKPAAGIAAVEVTLHDLLDDGTEKTLLPLEMAAYRQDLASEPWNMTAALNIAYCLQDKGDLDAAIVELETRTKRAEDAAKILAGLKK